MNKGEILIYGTLAILIAVILIANLYVFGSILLHPEKLDEFKSMSTPSGRLKYNPDLIAACQYEYWMNTTQSTNVVISYGIIKENRTDVNWVCYYRDNHTTVQRIGAFKDTSSASNYLWYYYENGKSYPLIYTR